MLAVSIALLAGLRLELVSHSDALDVRRALPGGGPLSLWVRVFVTPCVPSPPEVVRTIEAMDQSSLRACVGMKPIKVRSRIVEIVWRSFLATVKAFV